MADELTTKEAADLVGLAASTLRKYLLPNQGKPFLASRVRESRHLIDREVLLAWHEAYKAAPKLGRRGDGSVRWKGRRRK